MVVASCNSMLILPRCAGGAIWRGRGVGCGGNDVRSHQAPGRKARVPLQPACRMPYRTLVRTVQWREQCTRHPATDLREVQRCTLSGKACMQLHQRECRCELGTHGALRKAQGSGHQRPFGRRRGWGKAGGTWGWTADRHQLQQHASQNPRLVEAQPVGSPTPTPKHILPAYSMPRFCAVAFRICVGAGGNNEQLQRCETFWP